jgi:hypothetical protein
MLCAGVHFEPDSEWDTEDCSDNGKVHVQRDTPGTGRRNWKRPPAVVCREA